MAAKCLHYTQKWARKNSAVTEQINVRVDEIPNLLFIFQFHFLIKGRNRDKNTSFHIANYAWPDQSPSINAVGMCLSQKLQFGPRNFQS